MQNFCTAHSVLHEIQSVMFQHDSWPNTSIYLTVLYVNNYKKINIQFTLNFDVMFIKKLFFEKLLILNLQYIKIYISIKYFKCLINDFKQCNVKKI